MLAQPVEGVADRIALEVAVRQRLTIVEWQFGLRRQAPRGSIRGMLADAR